MGVGNSKDSYIYDKFCTLKIVNIAIFQDGGYIVLCLEAHLDFLEIAAYGSTTDEMGRKMCKCISMDQAMSGG